MKIADRLCRTTLQIIGLIIIHACVSNAQTSSVLTSPANGATVSPQTQLTWTAVPGATSYGVWIGTSPNTYNAFYYGTTATNANVTLQPGTTYYVTLWTNNSGAWMYTTSTFRTAATAYLTSPANGATVSPQTQLTWTAVPGATSYGVWIGTSPNTYNAFYYGTTATNANVTLQPGTTYYVTLWTNNSGTWTTSTSTFQTSQIAVVINPAPGASNLDTGAPVSLTWTPVGATSYGIWIGTSPGTYNAFYLGTTGTSANATLQPNTTYYMRLWTNNNGNWYYTDSVFSTGYPLAHLTYPANGATGIDLFQPFTWTKASGATKYVLTVSPTGYGIPDFYVSPGNGLVENITSHYIYGLQPNTTYYVQLCTQNPGSGGCIKSSFTTGATPAPPSDRNAFYQTVQNLTAQVRLMAPLNYIPNSGTALYQTILMYGGNPAGGAFCGDFSSTLADLLTQNHILARLRTMSLDGPASHIVTEYWDPFNQKWQVADATFGVVYFDPNSQTGQGAEDISSLLLADNLSAIEPLFVTSNGSLYMTSYELDPITFYANVQPFATLTVQGELNYVPNSPLPYLNDITSSAQGKEGLYTFQFKNQTDTITIQNGSSQLTISPVNTYGWASSAGLQSNWSIVSPIPDGMHIYSFKRIMY